MKLYELFDKPGPVTVHTDDTSHGQVSASFWINKNTGEVKQSRERSWEREDWKWSQEEGRMKEVIHATPDDRKDWLEYKLSARPIKEKNQLPHIEHSPWEELPHEDSYAALSLPEGTWEVHFSALSSNESNINFSPNRSNKITGTGRAIKVFSTILSVINKQVLSRPDVKHILVSSKKSESSRVKLYDRIVGRRAKKKWAYRGVVYWLL